MLLRVLLAHFPCGVIVHGMTILHIHPFCTWWTWYYTFIRSVLDGRDTTHSSVLHSMAMILHIHPFCTQWTWYYTFIRSVLVGRDTTHSSVLHSVAVILHIHPFCTRWTCIGSQTGPCTWKARIYLRKRQSTPDGYVAGLVSKGTYFGGLSWAAERQVDLCTHYQNLKSSYTGLNWAHHSTSLPKLGIFSFFSLVGTLPEESSNS